MDPFTKRRFEQAKIATENECSEATETLNGIFKFSSHYRTADVALMMSKVKCDELAPFVSSSMYMLSKLRETFLRHDLENTELVDVFVDVTTNNDTTIEYNMSFYTLDDDDTSDIVFSICDSTVKRKLLETNCEYLYPNYGHHNPIDSKYRKYTNISKLRELLLSMGVTKFDSVHKSTMGDFSAIMFTVMVPVVFRDTKVWRMITMTVPDGLFKDNVRRIH